MVRWSVALSSFPSLLLFYSAWNPTVWLQLCVLECVCSPRRQDDKKAVSLFVTWVGLFCALALTCSIQQTDCVHLYASVSTSWGGARKRVMMGSSHLKLWSGAGGGEGGCLKVCYVYLWIQTFLSPGREWGQASHLWLFSSDELWCVCMYYQFLARPSHLWLLCSYRLGSGLGRLVALVEVSFPQLLWSFSPQNNLLNTDTEQQK